MDPAAHLDHLRVDVERLLATPADALGAPVAACPGWTVADLLRHHAGVLSFATSQLRAAPGSDLVPFDPPAEVEDPVEQLRRSADSLLAELVATDPAEHRPNWADAPTAAFWFRRMAQEAAVHRWDVEAAHRTPEPIDTALAVDGIDELVDTFLPFARRRGITGDGVEVTRGHAKADMAGRGPASDLLLLVWNRRPVAVETFGEPDLLAWWSRKVRI